MNGSYAPSTSSGLLTGSSNLVVTGPALLCNVTHIAGTSGTSSVLVYDDVTVSGNIIWESKTPVNGAAVVSAFSIPITCNNGIFVAVVGTGSPSAVITYTRE